MDKNMQQQILKTIEDNLPAQVGNILQERLAKLDRLERENTGEKLKMAEEKIREFNKQIEKYENLKTELDSKELDLKRREDELKLQTEINRVTIRYEQKIAGVYKDVNEKILDNRTIRETIHKTDNIPRYAVYETRNINGNVSKTTNPTGIETTLFSETTEKGER